jgi:hypothetical protein
MKRSMIVALLLGGILFVVSGCGKNKQEESKKAEVSTAPKEVNLLFRIRPSFSLPSQTPCRPTETTWVNALRVC